MHSNVMERKPGRPRIIPKELEPEVISLYKQGLGYRATARELGKKDISKDERRGTTRPLGRNDERELPWKYNWRDI